MRYYLLLLAILLVGTGHAQIPKLDWHKSMGGYSFDYSVKSIMDDAGNIYQTGWFRDSADLDPGSGVQIVKGASLNSDFFIQKLDAAGNLQWVHGFGGQSTDWSWDMALDGNDNVYVTGWFRDTIDFDPGAGQYLLQKSLASQHFFAMKLDTAGVFKWAVTTGSTGNAEGRGIATDDDNNVYLTGFFRGSVDFDPGPGTDIRTAFGHDDGFLLSLDSLGNFRWVVEFNATTHCGGKRMIIDQHKNIYLSGEFVGTVDMDPGSATQNISAQGQGDVFLAKLDSNANLIWVDAFGGSSFDDVRTILIDKNDDILLTGGFNNTVDFDPKSGVQNKTSNGNYDAYIVKLDTAGNLKWVNTFGGDSTDVAVDVAEDANGNYWVTGFFFGTADLDPGTDVAMLNAGPRINGFLSSFDETGNFKWTKHIGEGQSSIPTNMKFDAQDDLLMVGHFLDSIDLDPSIDSSFVYSNGLQDVFIAKYTQCMPDLDTLRQWFCHSYTWSLNNQTYQSAGMYTEQFLNATKCDSNHTLQLIQTSVDTMISYDGSMLTSADSLGSYQWLNCDSVHTPISGATSRDYQPMVNGNYAVVISRFDCQDTSLCIEVNNIGSVGVDDWSNDLEVKVYPNPSDGMVFIHVLNSNAEVKVLLRDVNGRILQQNEFETTEVQSLQLTQSPGVYLLEVISSGGSSFHKIILR